MVWYYYMMKLDQFKKEVVKDDLEIKGFSYKCSKDKEVYSANKQNKNLTGSGFCDE